MSIEVRYGMDSICSTGKLGMIVVYGSNPFQYNWTI